MSDADPRPALAAVYDALWDAAAPAVRRGEAALDPWIGRKAEDARLGVTLLARPAPALAGRLSELQDELRALEPAQHYQPAADLHLTVLTPFTATVDHAPYLAHVDAYRAAVAEAVDGAPRFVVDVAGLTLSPAAVLAQGFPRDGTLEEVRGRLRAGLTARGLGAALDRRYRLVTAHTTLVRFSAPLRDPARFVDALAAARRRTFGAWQVDRLELVVNNWYLSAERTRVLAQHTLGGPARG